MRRKGRFRFRLWWLRLLHFLPAALLGLLLFYWVVTSSWFLRYAVLPRIARNAGMPLSARSIQLELWSGRLTLTDFSAGTETGGLFFCRGKNLTLQIRYRELWDRVIALDDIGVNGADVRITTLIGRASSSQPPASAAAPVSVPSSGRGWRLHLSRLNASDSRLQLIWENQSSGRSFDLKLRGIEAGMDQLSNGTTGNLEFTCQPDYEDGLLDLTAVRARGHWKLEFDDRLHLTGTDWITDLESGAGRFGRFDWPASLVSARIQYRNGKWNFIGMQGHGECAETAASTFRVAGSLSGSGFEIAPESRMTLSSATLQEWFGADCGTMTASISAEGSGSYGHPAVGVTFDWRHEGTLPRNGEILTVPPLHATGHFRTEFDQASRHLILSDTEIAVTPGNDENAIRLRIPKEHPVTYDWKERVFADTAGDIEFELQNLTLVPLAALFPLPSGWRLSGGIASGRMTLATLAAGTPQLGATGEIAILGLNLDTPAGPGESGDLTLALELSGAETQWKLPRWNLSYRKDGRDLLQLTGEADWNLQTRSIGFRLEAPMLSPEFLPAATRDIVNSWLDRLHAKAIRGAIQGQFQPGKLQVNNLELHSEYLDMSMQPDEFSAGNGWNTTRWTLTARQWPAAAATALSGEAALEWQEQQLNWNARWHLDGMRFRDQDCGPIDGECDGSWAWKPNCLDIQRLQWNGAKTGSGVALPFSWECESQRLLQPLQLDWQNLKSELVTPQLEGGVLNGKTVLLQQPDRWHVAITADTVTPFFWKKGMMADWPLAPTVHMFLEKPFQAPDLDMQLTLEQKPGSGANAPAYNLQSAIRWNPATSTGSAEIDVIGLSIPRLPGWAVHNSEFKLQIQPQQFTLDGKVWASISGYLQGNAALRVEATPEAVTVSACSGRITTLAAEPAFVWDGTMTWTSVEPKTTAIHWHIQKLDLPLLQPPVEADAPKQEEPAPPQAATPAPPTTANPWQFNFGPRLWKCDFTLDDFTPASGVSCKVVGEWSARQDQFEFKTTQLICNGAPLDLSGSLHNTPADYPKFTVQLQGSNIDTAPWWHSLFQEETTNAGILRQLEVDLAGSAAPAPRFWDEVSGYAQAEVANVDIENQFQKTTLGKLLFLPLEAYLRICSVLPGSNGNWLPQVSGFKPDFLSLSTPRRFTFDRGKVRLSGDRGIITVEQFDLHGSEIKQLQFSGTFGCGTNRKLDLDSTIDFQGVILPLKFKGTLEDPQLQWDQTTWRFVPDNALSLGAKLLNTGAELLDSGTKLFTPKREVESSTP